VLLQKFAGITKELDPVLAKKAFERCLNHPEIDPDKKQELQRARDALEGTVPPTPEQNVAG
jgi:hypothetical protein